MKHLHTLLLLAAFLLLLPPSACAQAQYTSKDSLRIVRLMADARKQPQSSNLVLYLARQLRGIPYVAKTLEKNDRERLVVNIRQLDCTTYVENVVAMYLCVKSGKTDFSSYCRQLQAIRYQGATVAYTHRLHYFSSWIDENTRCGRVEEVSSPNPPFSATQKPQIDYMTKHTEQYPMLVKNPTWTNDIRRMEQSLAGRTYRYIPKSAIKNTRLLRKTIHDGDIIAIATKKQGLDTSHIGIAVWHKDGLHLLNASMIRKKVVEEPKTLYAYMQEHPSQLGIRIIRIK